MRLKIARFRLGLRSLMVFVALLGLAVWGTMSIWSPTRRLGRLLQPDQPDYIRREAASALGHEIPAWEVDRAVNILIATLDDPSPRVREYAGAGLAQIGPRAERAVPGLIDLLEDEDRFVRFSAARALAWIVKAPSDRYAEVVAALKGRRDDEDEGVRKSVAESLVELGQSGAAAGIVLDALMHEDEYDREWAFSRIRESGNRRLLIEPVFRELGSEDARHRELALDTLQEFSPSRVVLALRALLEADRPEVREWAGVQLDRLTPQESGVEGGPDS